MRVVQGRTLSAHEPNLFRRLRRFAPAPGRDAREDRLTEALAATFEGAPEAARDLAAAWFGFEAVGPLTVTTQRWVRTTERLDIELVFGSTSRPDARVWLEAKVDATPYRDQAERYLRVLRELQGTRAGVAWLLPTGSVVVGDSPADVDVRTWQDLAMTLSRWVERHAEDSTAYPPRLVKQFIDHLEEEGLAVTQPLTEQDVAAVDGYELARRRLKEMFRLASVGIHARRSRLSREVAADPEGHRLLGARHPRRELAGTCVVRVAV